MAHASRQLAAAGKHCDSLAELADISQLSSVQEPIASAHEETECLQRLLKEAVALAAKLGSASQDPQLRSIYFGLCRHNQRAAAEIARFQLWDGTDPDAF